jgi:pimeloyl-ACP methyl ester carboxylesterase
VTRSLRTIGVSTALLLAMVASGCTSSEGGSASRDLPFTESAKPAGDVPKGLEKFYSQKITWEDCEPYASSEQDREVMRGDGLQCTRLTVPLDYAKPTGDTIKVGVLRKPATGDRIGALVTNPGGPGVAGMANAARLAGEDSAETLAERFDFVGFDPRGVGASEPAVTCLTGEERDEERADDDELDTSAAGVQKVEKDEQDYVDKCVERTEHGEDMLANIGTRDVVKDMDVLRSALGDKKLTYLGYSYGTRIGSTYAQTFPKNVRALVLDGALDPTQDAVEELIDQGEGFQKAFDDFVDWCIARDDCSLGRDKAAALGNFQQLVRPLGQHPVEVGDGRKLSYEDATTGVVQALYSQDLWEYLNTGLNELRQQRGQTLMLLADLYLERDKSGEYSNTQDAFTAIHCVDDPRITDPAVLQEAQRRYKEAAPFLDDGNPPSPARDACAFWPVPSTGERDQATVTGLPPTLVISTTGDPATPYDAGVGLAGALGGRLLTYEATQHTVFLQGNTCVDDAGTAYLIDGALPAEGTRCTP